MTLEPIKMAQSESRAKILVVDDAPQNLRPIQALLTLSGYEVITACDGEEALLKVEQESPDLVLLDVMIPKLTGYEVCARLKGDERTRLIPVVIVISPPIKEQIVRGFEVGADDFLHRPLGRAELVARVGSLIQAKRLNDSLVNLENAILALAAAVEAKDPYTEGHLKRVANYATSLGKEIGLSYSEQRLLKKAATLHDVGKIGIRESVLLKPGPLTDEEFDHIKSHCVIGERICSPLGDRFILEVIRHHHERYDGRGYPDGLAGSEIPLAARIMALVDTYDALTHDRPYRRGFPHEGALNILRNEIGRQFDAALALPFIDMVESGCFQFVDGECSPEV